MRGTMEKSFGAGAAWDSGVSFPEYCEITGFWQRLTLFSNKTELMALSSEDRNFSACVHACMCVCACMHTRVCLYMCVC